MSVQSPQINNKQKEIIIDMIHKKMNEQLKLMREAEEAKQIKKLNKIKITIGISILVAITILVIRFNQIF